MSAWWLGKEFIINDRIDVTFLFIFALSTALQLTFCLFMLDALHKYKKSKRNVDLYKTCSTYDFSICIILWLIIITANWEQIPLFSLAGSDQIVSVLAQNKVNNLISFGFIGAFGIIFLFIGLLDSSTSRRNLALLLSLFTVALFMKKSGVLYWILFYFYFKSIFFNYKITAKYILLFLSSLIFGIYTFFQTVGLSATSFLIVLGAVTNLLYTSSSSYLNYLLLYGGIDYAPNYQETLPDIVGWISYIFNPIVKLTTGSGIEAAIGPYVISRIFNLSDNLFGFNPTLVVELWFVLGPQVAVIIFIPLYAIITILCLRMVRTAFRNASRQAHVVHFYMIYALINFSINMQYDLLNSVKSLIFSTLAYLVLVVLLRAKFKS